MSIWKILFGGFTTSNQSQTTLQKPVSDERRGDCSCYKCGKRLVRLDRKGQITVGSHDDLARAELRCPVCSLLFCMSCASRSGLQTACPSCSRLSNPAMFVL